jgi:23S rRNA (adenine2503-C2)-methyltransferase
MTRWSTEVIATSQSWARRHHRTVTYVYLLLPGVNDALADAHRLVGLLGGSDARINLMRWNPVLGGDTYQRVDDDGLTTFKRRLEQGHLDVTVRDTQGKDIDAACGQLWLRNVEPTR